jgi:hypothetical protein
VPIAASMPAEQLYDYGNTTEGGYYVAPQTAFDRQYNSSLTDINAEREHSCSL